MSDAQVTGSVLDAATNAREVLKLALPRFGLASDLKVSLLPVSENVAFKVQVDEQKEVVLRVSLPGGYERQQRVSEIAWIEALGQAGAPVAHIYRATDGEAVIEVTLEGSPEVYQVSMFECVPGVHLDETDMSIIMPKLGVVTAKLHNHAIEWERPANFSRLAWDLEAAFGPRARWGDWRTCSADQAEIDQLARVEDTIRARLERFGKSPDRFGLIHADLRAANLLVDGDDFRIIDFDDCGPGWFLYDLATALTFIEDTPEADELIALWLAGYRTIRSLDPEHEREIGTFLLLRRLLTISFLASNPDTEVSIEMLPGLVSRTCEWSEGLLKDLASRQ